ncbi:MAG TPA: sensor histidine kinase [Geminicoccus sp.]|uniref:sensor histidine kinase n=1 Tax=Geminicoccus sp. TaxID=2024832 RepID=UPI002C06509B|nr:sensor histidine kinase [Geminicoccus sp.]HWL68936.1 sensor histidine kinase [Geminicoccus sp.]
MTLRLRLILLGLLSFLPMAVVVLVLHLQLRTARETEARQTVTRQTQQAAAEISRMVDGMKALLRAVAAAPRVRQFDQAACIAYLDELLDDRVLGVDALAVFDLKGQRHCVGMGDRAAGLNSVALRQEALRANDFVVGAYTEAGPAKAILPFALPLHDAAGRPLGVVAASLSLFHLNNELRNWPLARGSAVTIADRDGVILARTPLPERFVGTPIPEAYQDWVHGALPGTEEARSQDGTMRLISYVPVALSPEGLYVSTGIATETLFRDVDRATMGTLAIMSAGLVVMTLGVAIGARLFIRRPVDRLLRAAEGWSADPPDPPDPPTGRDEFSEIGRALHRMGQAFATQRRREAEHQADLRTLSDELSHRIKNSLMIVQAIVMQALRNAKVERSVQERIEARLTSLARSHELLMRGQWQGTRVDLIVAQALEPFGYEQRTGGRFAIEGPVVRLPARLTLSVGMALHELATNASKYGALSVPEGRVRIDWQVIGGREPRLRLRWQESGGPLVSPPTSQGFGTRLIQRWLGPQLGGGVRLDFARTGVGCTMEIQLTDPPEGG